MILGSHSPCRHLVVAGCSSSVIAAWSTPIDPLARVPDQMTEDLMSDLALILAPVAPSGRATGA